MSAAWAGGRARRNSLASSSNPNVDFNPPRFVDSVVIPLGPDAGIVAGEAVFSGTANGEPFASHVRFSDTFRRIDGEWKAVYIQATDVAGETPPQS
jgi:hypothetical protein